MATKPAKPTGFPLFPHASGQWAKKASGKFHYFGPWADPQAALDRYNTWLAGEPRKPPRLSRNGDSSKPYPDFPLYHHPTGQWAKRILTKVHYFGTDQEEALAKYHKQKDDLHAGRKPTDGKGLTVAKLVDQFLAEKRRRTVEGPIEERLSPRTLNDYERICGKVKEILGNSQVTSLPPSDFAALRSAFAETHGLVALGKDIAVTRILFKYAYDKQKITQPLNFGTDEFKRPNRKALRLARRKAQLENGRRMFQPDDIRRILGKAGVQLRAMIYLGINCGLGNNDCAMLTLSDLDLDRGWLDFPRPKTGVDRRCPLWPETIAACRAAIDARPKPSDPADRDRVFITRKGNTWEPKSISDNPVSKEMTKVLKALKLHRPGLGFYALRHTFQTIGERTRDDDAVRYIMGHAEASNDMGAVYSEGAPTDNRLRAVTDYVREWLLTEHETIQG